MNEEKRKIKKPKYKIGDVVLVCFEKKRYPGFYEIIYYICQSKIYSSFLAVNSSWYYKVKIFENDKENIEWVSEEKIKKL